MSRSNVKPRTSSTEARRRGPVAHRRRAKRSRVPLAVGCALAVAAVALISVTVLPFLNGTPKDMRGMPVLTDSRQFNEDELKEMNVVDLGGRLTVPAVGLDVPLHAMSAVGGAIDPPGFASAYLVRNMGVMPADADSGTVYVAMHSLRGGGMGPGNYLIDVAQQTARVRDGDTVTLDGVSYQVDDFEIIPKSLIGGRADLWSTAPGRAVLITCLQNVDGGPSRNVIVISASRSPAP